MTKMIYVDNAATTRVLPEVLSAMEPYLHENYGNPSSVHKLGTLAGNAILAARKRMAEALSCYPDEIIFTSGGTEADNAAIIGAALASTKKGIITSQIEHPAVLNTCGFLEKMGYRVSRIGADPDGLVQMDQLVHAITDDTALISVMMVNNETGVIQPYADIGQLARKHAALYFCDAVQGIGAVPFQFSTSPVDLLSLSGHKLGAPKGIGALIVRRGTRLHPFLHGGGQERGLRSGTENVAGIVGLSVAVEMAMESGCHSDVLKMKQQLISCVSQIPHSHINGSLEHTIPGTLNVSFDYVNGYDLVSFLSAKGICASSSSACASSTGKPSHVLSAMGCSPERAGGSLRFSVNRFNTMEEIQSICEILPQAVQILRKQNPSYVHRKGADTDE